MQSQSSFMGCVMKRTTQHHHHRHPRRGMQLGMLLGSDSGILGIGAPEVVVTLLVGYFILGPSELYKITKEIGKFIQNFRSLGSEATKSFETAMEDQLQMQEIRKAQRELNSAFSFRRSINVDQDGEAFAESSSSSSPPVKETDKTLMMNENDDGKKKKKRRIKKKAAITTLPLEGEERTPIISDIDMASMFPAELEYTETALDNQMGVTMEQPQKSLGDVNSIPSPITSTNHVGSDLLSSSMVATATTNGTRLNHTMTSTTEVASTTSRPTPWYEEDSNARFVAQMNGNWNQRILDDEEQLSPLAQVMEKLALLEEERERINLLLEEEFRQRKQNDEKFYQQKRALLENAAQQISTSVYGNE